MFKHICSGDRVAYTAAFLRNTGQHTGPAGKRRGECCRVEGRFAHVLWDGDDHQTMVAVSNICRVGSVYFGDNATQPRSAS